MEFTPATMNKLVELLREPEPEVLQGEDAPCSGHEITSVRGNLSRKNVDEKKPPKTIEEYEEQEAAEFENLGSLVNCTKDKKTPQYSMNYQQSVTAEDVYLQIGPKTPSSASCENLIVKIKMAGDKKDNVELSVDTNSVTVSSSQYFLKLPLPHSINPDNSKAGWDCKRRNTYFDLEIR